MYHHSLSFLIVSDSDRLVKILKNVEPLEDCDYSFSTSTDIQTDKTLDVAVIYDAISGGGVSFAETACEEKILVLEAGNPLIFDAKVVEQTSDMWILPKGEALDERLLTLHFSRLCERMKRAADARKQGICFDTIVNSVPDIAWFKDTEGAHLIVNDSFCELVGKSKKQIYKQGHCYIWDASKEDEEVCLSSDRIIMESRATNTFEEAIKAKDDICLLKSYKSALVDEDGSIFGTCGIAHDVTELKNMGAELDIVLESIPYAVLVESPEGIVLNKNSRFDECFPDYKDLLGKPSEVWKSRLAKKLIMEDGIKEVVMQSGDDERILVFDEEPIYGAFDKVIGNIVTLTDITLERSISRRNEHTANTDFLTKLNNRRGLMKFLEERWNDESLIYVLMDLDNFKQVNDVYGHAAGDRVLIAVSDILRICYPEDFLVRMGGDEFMIISQSGDVEAVKAKTAEALRIMREEYKGQKEFSHLTASAGILPVSSVSLEGKDIYDMLHNVDDLMYQAKNGGKNRFCVGE